ncbi:MAG TPA: 2-C-methyl-D-erythritol 4-phosphate cytidylyltransferase [Thermoanaerobaculia bacterium]
MALLLIVAAAGSGARLGRGEPKALVSLAGRPMLVWVFDALAPLSFDRAVVSVPPDRLEDFAAVAGARALVVPGGATRAESVRRGFDALAPADTDHVCIHDAARPLVTAAETRAVIEAARVGGAAIAAMPMADTVKRVEPSGRTIAETLDRSTLWAAATPQVFRVDLLRAALARGGEATDEAALVEAAGFPVTVVPVSRLAFKITTAEDLALAEAWKAWRA